MTRSRNFASAESGAYTRAAPLWGAAQGLRDRLHVPLSDDMREEYAAPIAELRTTLGPTAFDKAWEIGAAFDFDKIITFALN